MTPLISNMTLGGFGRFGFALLGCALIGTDAAQAQAISHAGSYNVFLGGAKIAEGTFKMSVDGAEYEGAAQFTSEGILDWFDEAWIETSARGAVEAREAFEPHRFIFRSAVDEHPQTLEVSYESGAPSEVFANPPFDPRPWEIDPAEQGGALDPLSAMIAAFFPEDEASLCDRTIAVFDGRRRYDVVFKGEDRRQTMDDGSLEIDCNVEWRRVAGFKPNRESADSYDFYMRFRVEEDGVMNPIRAWADTEFGAAIAVLRGS